MTNRPHASDSAWNLNSRNLSRWVLAILRYAFVFASVAYILLYIANNWHGVSEVLFAGFEDQRMRWILPLLVGCYFSSWLIVAIQYYMPLRRHCPSVNFAENLSLIILGALLNYTPFKAGVLYRFNYMKSRHGFSYTRFAGLQLARLFLMMLIAGLVGISALAYLVLDTEETSMLLLLSSMGLVSIGASPAIALRLFPAWVNNNRHLRDIFLTLDEMQHYPREASIFVLLLFAQVAVLLLQYHLIFLIAGLSPPFVVTFLLVPAIMVLGVISLSPGNIGFREMFVAAAFAISSNSFDSGVLVGVVDRAVIFSCTLVFGVLSFVYLELILRRSVRDKDPFALR